MIRFAILAGVSTDAQAAPDKTSIPDQIANCRAHIAAHNGVEAAGPYIMDGYSRTGYDSLEIAMTDIPPLGEAIRAAASDAYDILLMDNFDRLGDLGFIVKTRFKKLRKQLRSVRQSGKLIPPEQYDPYASEVDDIAMYVEGIIQTYRINKIRRGWNIGIPQRARDGLHPLSIPFGYRMTSRGQPAQPVDEETALIKRMVESFLSGRTYQSIADLANSSGVPPRRAKQWTIEAVRRIINNPFYAGHTVFGRLRLVDGKRIPAPPSQWVTGVGQHVPIYDDATWQAILAELERRAGLRSRQATYALTGLLVCAECGRRLHRHGKVGSRYPVDLSCPNGHIHIRYDVALKITAQELVKQLTHVKTVADPPENAAERFLWAIRGQEDLRRQIQAGFEGKLYTLPEAQARITAIEAEIARLHRQRERALQQDVHRAALLALAQNDLSLLGEWIQTDDPTTVNRLLTALCERIILDTRYQLKIVFR